MKLVMVFNVGDGYTYNCDVIYPIEYERVERAEYDFFLTWKEKIEKREKEKPLFVSPDFEMFGRMFDAADFQYWETVGDQDIIQYSEPKFYTLEEWWEKNLNS